MEKPKRSYYLPERIVEAFDAECQRSALVKERVVAAAILHFLDAEPDARQKMFERLEAFLHGRRGQRRA